MQPTRNNTGIAHENGSIESPHGHLKNRIEQALLLRGSSEFASIGEYQALIDGAVSRLNLQCQQKFEIEKPHLQPLPKYRVADYEVLTARASSRSTIEVRSRAVHSAITFDWTTRICPVLCVNSRLATRPKAFWMLRLRNFECVPANSSPLEAYKPCLTRDRA